MKLKQRIRQAIIDEFGFLPGQTITVQARLNFDYDLPRGTENGPWADGIPVDGRDVWQFDLIADDSMQNMLIADTASFQNLGRKVRPRCWPWSLDNELPLPRSG